MQWLKVQWLVIPACLFLLALGREGLAAPATRPAVTAGQLHTVPQLMGSADYAMLSNRWPCQRARALDSQLPTISKAVVWNTFGTNTTCLSKYLQDTRLRTLEVHLVNEVCVRNANCGSYELLYGLSVAQYSRLITARNATFMSKLRANLAPLLRLLQLELRPTTLCLISPSLESNLDSVAGAAFIDLVKPWFPAQCSMVWNPVRSGPGARPIPGVLWEMHHADAPLTPPCVSNLDGQDIAFPSRPAILPYFINSSQLPQYAQRYRHCVASFLWVAEDNGITGHGFVDPRHRLSAWFPSKNTMRLVVDALKQLGQ